MKKCIIGIIGFGMVGRAIQHGFAQIADFRIYDIDPIISENTFEETIRDSDFIFICVPTPSDIDTGECDISILEKTIEKSREYITPKKILIIKSTIPPGTTERIKKNIPHLRIVFNPEFLTARTSKLDFINSSRIIIGGDPDDLCEVDKLYRERFIHTPIYWTDPTTAEMVKYSANCFFSVKVSLMNEYYQICQKLGIDFEEVKKMLLADGRIGNSHMDVPGHDGDFGFGGLCFPKDLRSLIYKSRELGIDPKVLDASWKKNIEIRKNKDWLKIKGAMSTKNKD